MSRSNPTGRRYIPVRLAVAAVVVTGIGGAIAGSVIRDSHDNTVELADAGGSGTARTSTQAGAREHTPLQVIVAKMPPGWPATEVMRQVAERPLGDAAHERWRQAASLMPSDWRATDVMRRAAAQQPGEQGAIGTAARTDPVSAWQAYYELTHPDVSPSG